MSAAEAIEIVKKLPEEQKAQFARLYRELAATPDDEREADWSGARERLREMWGDDSAPGTPASRIVIESRR